MLLAQNNHFALPAITAVPLDYRVCFVEQTTMISPEQKQYLQVALPFFAKKILYVMLNLTFTPLFEVCKMYYSLQLDI